MTIIAVWLGVFPCPKFFFNSSTLIHYGFQMPRVVDLTKLSVYGHYLPLLFIFQLKEEV